MEKEKKRKDKVPKTFGKIKLTITDTASTLT
jgi:hypothetical protein